MYSKIRMRRKAGNEIQSEPQDNEDEGQSRQQKFSALIGLLNHQVDLDFYLTRRSIRFFKTLISTMNTIGIESLEKGDQNDIISFFTSWQKFQETQQNLVNRPFIEIAQSYIKEHLRVSYKIMQSVFESHDDITADLQHATKNVEESFIALKNEIEELNNNFTSSKNGRKVLSQLAMHFNNFSAALHGKFSIVFHPNEQFDRSAQKSNEIDATYHIECCVFCLCPDAKYDPWVGDHAKNWGKTLAKLDKEFAKLFNIKSKDSFEKNKQRRRRSNFDSEFSIERKRKMNTKHRNLENNNEYDTSNFPPPNLNKFLTQSEVIVPPKIGIQPKPLNNHDKKKQSETPTDQYDEEEEDMNENNKINYNEAFNSINKNELNDNPQSISDNEKKTKDRRQRKLLEEVRDLREKLDVETRKADQLSARLRAYDEEEAAHIIIEQENSNLRDENAQLRAKAENASKDINRLRAILKIDQIVSENENEKNETNNNKDDDDVYTWDKERLLIENENLRAFVKQIQSDHNISLKIVETTKNDKKQSRQEQQAELNALREVKENYLRIQAELSSLKDANIALEIIKQKKNKYKIEAEEYLNKIRELTKKVTDQNMIIDTKTKAIEQFQLIIDDLKSKQRSLLSSNSSFSSLSPLSSSTPLNLSNTSNSTQSGNTYNILSSVNMNDLSTLENARLIITKISAEKTRKEEEVRQLKQKVATVENSKEVLDMQIKSLKSNESNLSDEVKSKDDKIRNLIGQIEKNEQALKEMAVVRRNLAQSAAENDELNQTIGELKLSISRLNEKVKNLNVMEVQIEDANKAVSKLNGEVKLLREQLQAKDEQIKGLKDALGKEIEATNL